MKVLRVINSLYIGGAERSITTNVPIHNKNGFEMDVLLLNGAETHFKKKLADNGVKIISMGNHSGTRGLYSPLHIFRLMRLLGKYDIVHAHLFPSFYWVALAKFFSRAKTVTVYTDHSTSNRRRKDNWLFRKVESFIYKQYDAIIAISPETRESILAHTGTDAPVEVIYNGVDLGAFQPKSDFDRNSFLKLQNLSDDSVLMVQVAGFRPAKDQSCLIRSLKLLPENYCAVFVGQGELEEESKALAAELSVSHRCVFLGIQENVAELNSLSDLVVVSSKWEGFGRAAVEGMAAGKPVIASDVPGLANVVGEAGLLFTPGNEKELADAITTVMASPGLYKELCEKGKERSKLFGIDNMIAGYEQLYIRLTAK